MLEELGPIHRHVGGQDLQVVIDQLVPHRLRDRRLGIVEEGRHVVVDRSLPATLVIDEVRLALAQHDVAGLEVTVEEVVRVGLEQEPGQRAEILLQPLLVEGDVGQLQEMVLEVVQVPADRLLVERRRG
jgi:hypothetical protein